MRHSLNSFLFEPESSSCILQLSFSNPSNVGSCVIFQSALLLQPPICLMLFLNSRVLNSVFGRIISSLVITEFAATPPLDCNTCMVFKKNALVNTSFSISKWIPSSALVFPFVVVRIWTTSLFVVFPHTCNFLSSALATSRSPFILFSRYSIFPLLLIIAASQTVRTYVTQRRNSV